jgi:hypothetical protein
MIEFVHPLAIPLLKEKVLVSILEEATPLSKKKSLRRPS